MAPLLSLVFSLLSSLGLHLTTLFWVHLFLKWNEFQIQANMINQNAIFWDWRFFAANFPQCIMQLCPLKHNSWKQMHIKWDINIQRYWEIDWSMQIYILGNIARTFYSTVFPFQTNTDFFSYPICHKWNYCQCVRMSSFQIAMQKWFT
jgi:hypothetical protein